VPWRVGGCLGCFQGVRDFILSGLDWSEIFRRRPDLKPPGYDEAALEAREASQERYERLGKRRAGKSGKSKPGRFPGLKHGTD
jgi:hypothetical protein